MSVQSVDPRTGEAFGEEFADTMPEELDRVAASAGAAAPGWGAFSGVERARCLRVVAELLDEHTDELSELADRETGLGLPRLTGEVARTTFQLRMFADYIEAGRHLDVVIDHEQAGAPPAGHPDLRRMNVPIGPVAVYGASNFPFAFGVPGGDTASALAAGCPVVAKAHPAHPGTSVMTADLITRAMADAGAPAGTFALVHGFEAGQRLIQHPAIRAGAFTGSPGGGWALARLAAERPDPVPFYGELGSVNPVVVTPAVAANPGNLAAHYVGSLVMGSGQFCTNPGLLLVPAGSGLREQVVEEASTRESSVMLHGGVLQSFRDHLADLAAVPGVETLLAAAPGDRGFTTTAGILGVSAQDVLAHPELVRTECFGPAGVVVEYASEDELLAVLDAMEGSLAATIHGDPDEDLSATLVTRLAAKTGRLIWGGWPTGVAVSPAQNHGGPHPVTTNARYTSVGTGAVFRFLRPVAFQSVPAHLLPTELRD